VDDTERSTVDVELHVAAAGARHWLPRWFLDLNDSHAALVQVMRESGQATEAEEVNLHGPCFDDGVTCSKSGLPYPCTAIRYLARNTAFTEPVAAIWDRDWPGWRKARCGVDDPDSI
jgi:hypothetical protein